jgi:16S rRNA (cytidine1402-2'-O)-methyltransferase
MTRRRDARSDKQREAGGKQEQPLEGEAREPALAAAVATEAARRCSEALEPGLHLVATPIGNLGDITVRALATLARADVVCAEDTRHSRILLAHYGIGAALRPYHEHNADAERPRILALLEAGSSVALISDAGTPLISDPGFKLVREATERGIQVHALPGPSAVLAALAVSGLPTDAFMFAGFLPPRQAARRARLEELSNVPATVVLFEAPTRLADTLEDLAVVLPARPIVVARELTKRFEEVRRGTAAELADWARSGAAKGEIVVLVGPPAAREIDDAAIEAELDRLLPEMSLRDAARAIAEATGAARSHVYALGLKRKDDAQ